MSKTKIEWSEEVWNPTTGCTKVSQGCKNCYAETVTKRYAGRPGWPAVFLPWTPANAAENVVLHPDRLEAPFSWRTPRRVFVNSMSDLWHDEVPLAFIAQVYAVMYLNERHTFQVLTKRPQRRRDWLKDDSFHAMVLEYVRLLQDARPSERRPHLESGGESLYGNVWEGVTVENQRWADERIPILLDTPAAVRFVSAEPLLGPVDFNAVPAPSNWIPVNGAKREDFGGAFPQWQTYPMRAKLRNGVDWIIVGGESGKGHRPFDPDWARSIVAQCSDAGVPCFVKQLGGARPGNKLEDLPEDLRVREFPR